jgi:hypothetical protein
LEKHGKDQSAAPISKGSATPEPSPEQSARPMSRRHNATVPPLPTARKCSPDVLKRTDVAEPHEAFAWLAAAPVRAVGV